VYGRVRSCPLSPIGSHFDRIALRFNGEAILFDSIRKRSAAARIIEEQLYEQVVKELANGQRRNGLWAKAIANSNGHQEKAKAIYIQYRVQSFRDEYKLFNGENLAKEPSRAAVAIDEKENGTLEYSDAAKKRSTLWIHVLVWSIAGFFLLGFLSQ
jgi:hypothetical protein